MAKFKSIDSLICEIFVAYAARGPWHWYAAAALWPTSGIAAPSIFHSTEYYRSTNRSYASFIETIFLFLNLLLCYQPFPLFYVILFVCRWLETIQSLPKMNLVPREVPSTASSTASSTQKIVELLADRQASWTNSSSRKPVS